MDILLIDDGEWLNSEMLSHLQRSSLKHFTTLSLPPPQEFLSAATIGNSTAGPPAPISDDAALTNLILNSDPPVLSATLQQFEWTQSLVDSTLKRLWNHAPKALQFFSELLRCPHFSPAASSFDHAIDLAARLRDYRTAWSLVAQMRSLHLGPSPKTLSIIAERYVSSGKPDRAIKLFLSMHEHGCRQDLNSFNTILDILCKSRRVEMAYNKLFRILRGRFRADCVSYNILANGWCLVKRTPKALELLREMVERGVAPNSVTYNILLNGYFKAGQRDEGWNFFLEMKRRKCDIDVVTYTTVIHGLGVAGEIVRARKVFDEMVREGVLPSVATYNALIQVLCKKDSVDNAILVFEDMLRKDYMPNKTTYNVLIRGLCHAGHMERALELMSRMDGDNLPNVQTFNVMIRYLCDSGELERALFLFEKMGGGNCLPNLDTYNILISAMFVRKKAEDLLIAGKLLIEMVDRGFIPRKFTFNRVLNGLQLTGNQDFAEKILRMQNKFKYLHRNFKL